MVSFRVVLSVCLMVFCLIYCVVMPQPVLSPTGFFKVLGAIFCTAVVVGFIWPLPDLPELEDD